MIFFRSASDRPLSDSQGRKLDARKLAFDTVGKAHRTACD